MSVIFVEMDNFTYDAYEKTTVLNNKDKNWNG